MFFSYFTKFNEKHEKYKNMKNLDFLEVFKELQNSSEKQLRNKIINAKMMTKEFTLFRHYKMINEVLSL